MPRRVVHRPIRPKISLDSDLPRESIVIGQIFHLAPEDEPDIRGDLAEPAISGRSMFNGERHSDRHAGITDLGLRE